MWNTILGHEQPIARLQTALSAGRLPPAWLFHGPQGVGKFRVALTLAQAVHCRAGATAGHPCGQCPTCTRIAGGTHPDVLFLTPEKQEIRIDQVRAMQSRVRFHPLEGPAKLVLIDPADALHPAAANACLKILEEPPSATHFLLITAKAHRVLPTIRSRCVAIGFPPLPAAVVRDYLLKERASTREQAELGAHVGEGSIGAACALEPDLVGTTINELRQLVTTSAPTAVLETAERWAADGITLEHRLRLLAYAIRSALGSACGIASEPPTALADIVAVFGRYPVARLNRQLVQVLQLMREAETTTLNKQLLCETLLFTFARA